jgi:hypothetical protein
MLTDGMVFLNLVQPDRNYELFMSSRYD